MTLKLIDGHYQLLEKADCPETLLPVEAFDLETAASTGSKDIDSRISDSVRTPNWLPFAAERYEISKSTKDYFVVPVVIMPTDVPNRNLTAFPAKELAQFNVEKGCMAYNTWNGAPVHVEHKSEDMTKAIGAVVDTSLQKVQGTNGYDMWKVMALLAIDRTKSGIARQIAEGQRPYYSMGSHVRGYTCSVCGKGGMIKEGMKSKYDCLPCGTKHTAADRYGRQRKFSESGGQTVLGFTNVIYPTGYEISSVGVPAYTSAYTPQRRLKNL